MLLDACSVSTFHTHNILNNSCQNEFGYQPLSHQSTDYICAHSPIFPQSRYLAALAGQYMNIREFGVEKRACLAKAEEGGSVAPNAVNNY